MKKPELRPEKLDSLTWKISVPDGTLFVTLSEYGKKPWDLRLNLGKSGSTLNAWIYGLGRIISLALQYEVPMDEIIEELSGLTSDKVEKHLNKITIRSGPEGIAYALNQYVKAKKLEELDKEDLKSSRDYPIMEFGE